MKMKANIQNYVCILKKPKPDQETPPKENLLLG